MKKISFPIILTIAITTIVLFSFFSNEKSVYQSIMENFKQDYAIYSIPKPTSDINFAGERVPLENPDIWERYDKELLKNIYWQSNTLLLLKRSSKYFPIIEPILKKNNIPDDFKYLALIESGLEHVVSPAGATGFWQIMKATGKEYGLEINNEVDERYHLEKSTQVACDFLNQSKKKFGNWTMAAASYNVGRTGLQKQINRQSMTGYYNLLLNNETSRYVFRILALKEICQNPKKYGFKIEEQDYYQHAPTFEVFVDTTVNDWASFAAQYNINYKVLKIHNPWLRDKFLNNKSSKRYRIKIPEDGFYLSYEIPSLQNDSI